MNQAKPGVRNLMIGMCAACLFASGAGAGVCAGEARAPAARSKGAGSAWAPVAAGWAQVAPTWARTAAEWAPVAANWASAAANWETASEPTPQSSTASAARGGMLGITIQSGAGPGVVVGGAPANMPAAKAGIRQGDRILAIDGRRVADVAGLRQIVRAKSPGETVVVVIVREGEKSKVRVTLGGAGVLKQTTEPRVLVRPRAEAIAPGAPRAIGPQGAVPRRPMTVFRMPEGGNWSTVWPRQAGANQELNAQIERLTRQIKALNKKIDAMQRRIDAGR